MKDQPLPPVLRPYTFVLREGTEMPHNLLGYRLQLLDMRCNVLRSPHSSLSKEEPELLPEQLDFQQPHDNAFFLKKEN